MREKRWASLRSQGDQIETIKVSEGMRALGLTLVERDVFGEFGAEEGQGTVCVFAMCC